MNFPVFCYRLTFENSNWFYRILTYFVLYIRRFVKFILHLITRKSQIHRLCMAPLHTSQLTAHVHKSLSLSFQLPHLCYSLYHEKNSVNETFKQILRQKKIGENESGSRQNLLRCLEQIRNASIAIKWINQERGKRPEDNSHQVNDLLLQLWRGAFPEEQDPLILQQQQEEYSEQQNINNSNDNSNNNDNDNSNNSNNNTPLLINGRLITKRWGDLGFQGRDPTTDLRGAGVLGLRSLVSLVRDVEGGVQMVLEARDGGDHGRWWYPAALVGMYVTMFVADSMTDHCLDEHLYPVKDPENAFRVFGTVFAQVFKEFHQEWMSQDDPNIMQFESKWRQFKKRMNNQWHKISAQN